MFDNEKHASNLSDITSAADSKWNSVAVSANSATSLSLSGLGYGSYKAYAADVAGNLSAVASSSGSIQYPASYLGSGKGYVINEVTLKDGNSYGLWSLDNDGTADNISHDQLVTWFGFGDASSGTDTPDTISLNGVMIKLPSLSQLNSLASDISSVKIPVINSGNWLISSNANDSSSHYYWRIYDGYNNPFPDYTGYTSLFNALFQVM